MLQTSIEAVREARRLLGLGPGEEGSAFHVRRLDLPGAAYFLVYVAGQVASLDAATGALMASAISPRLPLTLTREAAIDRAGVGVMATAELVWAPSAASQSMFDPIWAITEGEQTLYVGQRGGVWNTLPMKRPGG